MAGDLPANSDNLRQLIGQDNFMRVTSIDGVNARMTYGFVQLMIDLANGVGVEAFLALINCSSFVIRLNENGYIGHLFNISARIGRNRLAACMTNSLAMRLELFDGVLARNPNVDFDALTIEQFARILDEE